MYTKVVINKFGFSCKVFFKHQNYLEPFFIIGIHYQKDECDLIEKCISFDKIVIKISLRIFSF